MRAVIEMEGGLITNILSDEPLEVLVIDRDKSDAEEGDDLLINLDGEKVFVQMRDGEENEMLVEDLFCRSLNGDNGEESGGGD